MSLISEFICVYQVDTIVNIMIVDGLDYLNVWLKGSASFLLLSRNSFWTKPASYEYKNKSANKGAHKALIGMLTECWKTLFPKVT
jgi:hypothetical protein